MQNFNKRNKPTFLQKHITVLSLQESMKKQIVFYLFLLTTIWQLSLLTGCANIIPPLGGPKDTLPPVLMRSLPVQHAKNVTGKTITLNFDEYVQVDNAFQNLIVSPTPEKFPLITNKLREITIKMWDTLEPNTTYSFNFGNSIKDVNEGNIFRNFTYVFSTGSTIDSLSLAGNVILAENGKVDSTLIVLLHRHLDDSAVVKEKPRFVTKLDGKGNFRFNNLPAGTYGLFALKDEGFKKYTDSSTMFAFASKPVIIGADNQPVTMYAFVAQKEKRRTTNTQPSTNTNAPKEKSKEKVDTKLRFSLNMQDGQQDLLGNLQITFSKTLKDLDSSKIILTDDKYNPIKGIKVSLDSLRKIVTIQNPWREKQGYKLLLLKGVATDSGGNSITKNDTIPFKAKPESAYGSVLVTFTGLDLAKHPVLQWVQSDVVVKSIVLTTNRYKAKLFEPGSYEMRILFDTNQNGKWDTGDYWKKVQPEIVQPLKNKANNDKATVKANWDNEFPITL